MYKISRRRLNGNSKSELQAFASSQVIEYQDVTCKCGHGENNEHAHNTKARGPQPFADSSNREEEGSLKQRLGSLKEVPESPSFEHVNFLSPSAAVDQWSSITHKETIQALFRKQCEECSEQGDHGTVEEVSDSVGDLAGKGRDSAVQIGNDGNGRADDGIQNRLMRYEVR